MHVKVLVALKVNLGAPIVKEEIIEIKNSFGKIKKRLSKQSVEQIKNEGMYVELKNGELETPLNNGKSVFILLKKTGVTKCVFERKL